MDLLAPTRCLSPCIHVAVETDRLTLLPFINTFIHTVYLQSVQLTQCRPVAPLPVVRARKMSSKYEKI